MLLTKATIITWTVDPLGNPDLNTERWDKLLEMSAAGKTDMSYEEVNPTVYKRFWADGAAADEYIAFIMSLDAKYGPGLVSGTETIDVNVTT